MDNQLGLIKKMVDEAARRIWKVIDPSNREGRPPKAAEDKAKAILVQQYFMATDRLAAGLMWFLREKLEISERLTPKDIERAYDDPDAIAILIEMFRMTNEPVKDRESEFSIDGSGLPTSIKQNYANDQGDEKKRVVYDMLIGMIGVNTKLFTAVEITGPGSESPYLEPLLDETQEMYTKIDSVCVDAGYISRDNCTAIANAGAVPYIYPKEGITLKQKGSIAWKKMLLALIDDPQKWLEGYHKRSISESVNSVWK
jgi:transposase